MSPVPFVAFLVVPALCTTACIALLPRAGVAPDVQQFATVALVVGCLAALVVWAAPLGTRRHFLASVLMAVGIVGPVPLVAGLVHPDSHVRMGAYSAMLLLGPFVLFAIFWGFARVIGRTSRVPRTESGTP